MSQKKVFGVFPVRFARGDGENALTAIFISKSQVSIECTSAGLAKSASPSSPIFIPVALKSGNTDVVGAYIHSVNGVDSQASGVSSTTAGGVTIQWVKAQLSSIVVTWAANAAISNAEVAIVLSNTAGEHRTLTLGIHEVKQGEQGATGATGPLMRPCGVPKKNQAYYNNDNYVDVVVVKGNTLTYYKLRDYVNSTRQTSYTPTTDAQLPPTNTTNWEEASNLGFVASSALIAGTGYIDVLGTGSMFVGQQDRDTDLLNGWLMTAGSIKHRGTQLELTSDGFINDPDGLHFKVGGTNTENKNLLYNAYFDRLLCTASGNSGIEGGGAYLQEGGHYGISSLVIGGLAYSSGGMITSTFMGGQNLSQGIYLTAGGANNGYYTFSCYAYANNGTGVIEIYASANKGMTSLGSSPLATITLDRNTLKRYTVTFRITTAAYIGFRAKLTLGASAEGEMLIDAVKLEKGQSATAMSDTTLDAQLLPTGIDIEERTIRLTTDNLICQNNSGDKTMWLDSNGNLGTSGNIFTGKTTITSEADMKKFFYDAGQTAYINDPTEAPDFDPSTDDPTIYAHVSDINLFELHAPKAWIPDIFKLSDIVEFNGFPSNSCNIVLPLLIPTSATPSQQSPTAVTRCDVIRTYTTYKTGEGHLMSFNEFQYLVGKKFTFLLQPASGGINRMYFTLPTLRLNNGQTTVSYTTISFYQFPGLMLEYVTEEVYINNSRYESYYPKLLGELNYRILIDDSDWGNQS